MARYGAAEMAPVPEPRDMEHLTFREELHALEAVVAGQGIGIFSDALIAPELSAGSLVKAFNLTLPGYRFHVVRRHDQGAARVPLPITLAAVCLVSVALPSFVVPLAIGTPHLSRSARALRSVTDWSKAG